MYKVRALSLARRALANPPPRRSKKEASRQWTIDIKAPAPVSNSWTRAPPTPSWTQVDHGSPQCTIIIRYPRSYVLTHTVPLMGYYSVVCNHSRSLYCPICWVFVNHSVDPRERCLCLNGCQDGRERQGAWGRILLRHAALVGRAVGHTKGGFVSRDEASCVALAPGRYAHHRHYPSRLL